MSDICFVNWHHNGDWKISCTQITNNQEQAAVEEFGSEEYRRREGGREGSCYLISDRVRYGAQQISVYSRRKKVTVAVKATTCARACYSLRENWHVRQQLLYKAAPFISLLVYHCYNVRA